jgi:hypothetical protein
VETLQQQIRMKMFINLAGGGKPMTNPVMQALADMQGKSTVYTVLVLGTLILRLQTSDILP